MNKILLVAFFALILTASPSYADCTREQAFNKMTKLNQLNIKLQSEVPLDPSKDPEAMNQAYLRNKEFADQMAPAGPLLAAGKYREACAIYDQVAVHFNFDLSSAKGLTMKQLSRDGGKSVSGGCDISEVARRTIALTKDFQTAYDAGRFTYQRQREFSKDSEEAARLSTTDPGRACQKLDELRKKYEL